MFAEYAPWALGKGFADCHTRQTALGKQSLPSAIPQALSKAFAECQILHANIFAENKRNTRGGHLCASRWPGRRLQPRRFGQAHNHRTRLQPPRTGQAHRHLLQPPPRHRLHPPPRHRLQPPHIGQARRCRLQLPTRQPAPAATRCRFGAASASVLHCVTSAAPRPATAPLLRR